MGDEAAEMSAVSTAGAAVSRPVPRPTQDPSTVDALTIDLYDDGGIRLSAPPPDERNRMLVSSSAIANWMRVAAARGWTVMVRGRPRSPLVAPVLKQIRETRLKFVLIDTDPPPVGRRRLTNPFRRLSSLGMAARDGSGLAVSDMLERGADPEVGGPVWRRLRKRGEIRAVADYQRLTGVRSKNAPPGTANAVVVTSAPYRWESSMPAWTLAVIAASVTIAIGPPLAELIGVLIACIAVPLAVLAVRGRPRGVTAYVAVDGTSIWWRRSSGPWEGPADLGDVQAWGASFDPGSSHATIVALVGDDFPREPQPGVPRDLRQWIGDRGHIRLSSDGFGSNRALIRDVLSHVPTDIETNDGAAIVFAWWGIKMPD